MKIQFKMHQKHVLQQCINVSSNYLSLGIHFVEATVICLYFGSNYFNHVFLVLGKVADGLRGR